MPDDHLSQEICAHRVEKVEDRVGGMERQLGLLNQQLQMVLESNQRQSEKLYGIDGTPGLVVEVDRLKNLNINERFRDLGVKVNSLERWQAKVIGAAVVGGSVVSLLANAVIKVLTH